MIDYGAVVQHSLRKSNEVRTALEDSRSENIAMERQIGALQEALSEQVTSALTAQTQLRDVKAALLRATSHSEETAAANAGLCRDNTQVTRQLRDAERKLMFLEESLAEAQSKSRVLTDSLRDASGPVTDAVTEVSRLRVELSQANLTVSQMQRAAVTREATATAVEVQHRLAKEHLAETRTKLAASTAKVEAQTTLAAEWCSRHGTLSMEFNELRRSYENLKAAVVAGQSEAFAVAQRMRALEEETAVTVEALQQWKSRCTVMESVVKGQESTMSALQQTRYDNDEEITHMRGAYHAQRLHCEALETDAEVMRKILHKMSLEEVHKDNEIRMLQAQLSRPPVPMMPVLTTPPLDLSGLDSLVAQELTARVATLQRALDSMAADHVVALQEKDVRIEHLVLKRDAAPKVIIEEDTVAPPCTMCATLRTSYERTLSVALAGHTHTTETLCQLKKELATKEVTHLEQSAKAKDVEELQETVRRLHDSLQRKTDEMSTAAWKAETLAEQVARGDQSSRMLNDELRGLKTRYQTTHDAHIMCVGELKASQRIRAEAEKEAEVLRGLLDASMLELNKAQRALSAAEGWRAALEESQKDLAETNATIASYERDLAELGNSHEDVVSGAEELERRCTRLELENDALNAECGVLRSSLIGNATEPRRKMEESELQRQDLLRQVQEWEKRLLE